MNNRPPGQPGRVLVIDDDPALREMVVSYFGEHDCQATGSSGEEDISHCLEGDSFDLIVLDVQLGRKDGFDVLRQIRASCDIPVIIITGQRVDEIDRIVGLELGADDYVTKPFSLRELLARSRATLRRHEMGRLTNATPRPRGRYRFNGWDLRLKSHTLLDPCGNKVALTKSEYALLVAFLNAPGRVLSREQLLQATRTHEDLFDRSIDVQVLRLRRKLEADPSNPGLIRTERGIGYLFDATVERTL